MLKKLQDIEEITRVLTVHRGHELAAVEILKRGDRVLKIRLQYLARAGGKCCSLDGADGPAQDEIDLDLHFDLAVTRQEFRLAGIGRGLCSGLEALLL